MKLRTILILACGAALSGCPLRPPIVQIDAYANVGNVGLVLFEQFEDGPMRFWISAKRLSDGKVILFSRGGGSKSEHPNIRFALDGKYQVADTSYHHPRIYEALPGKYIIYQVAIRGPEINSQIEKNMNLQPDTFEVVGGKATYIGSFNLYADRGIPLISPQTIAMTTSDKLPAIEQIRIAKNTPLIRDIISLKRK